MEYRTFGRTGWKVSETSIGTWQFGGDWGSVDEEAAFSIMKEALNTGVNFIDTADVYGNGRSESLVGWFTENMENKPYIATKFGRFPEPGWPENFTAEVVRQHAEASIKRLKVEALDLTQLHCLPPEELQKGVMFEELRALKEEGLIKEFGVSVESVEEAEWCLDHVSDLASIQFIFNIFRQKPLLEGLFTRARKQGAAIIVRLPLASGLLAGKFSKDTTFPEKDHRNYNRNGEAFNVGETFAGLPFELGVELSEELEQYKPESFSMVDFALRWILDCEDIATIIPGASKVEQARGNARASSLPPLPEQTHTKLREFYEAKVAENIRGVY